MISRPPVPSAIIEVSLQMLKLLGISQMSRNKMETTIEESRREEMLRVLQAAAKTNHRNSCQNMVVVHELLLFRVASVNYANIF